MCVTFRLSKVEFAALSRRILIRRRFLQLLMAITVLAIPAAIVLALLRNPWTIAAGEILVGWGALLLWIFAFNPGWQYRRHPRFGGDQSFCFSEAEISWSFAEGKSTVAWTYFRDAREMGAFYVLRAKTPPLGYGIPKRAFQTPADEHRFREMVRHRGLGRLTAN